MLDSTLIPVVSNAWFPCTYFYVCVNMGYASVNIQLVWQCSLQRYSFSNHWLCWEQSESSSLTPLFHKRDSFWCSVKSNRLWLHTNCYPTNLIQNCERSVKHTDLLHTVIIHVDHIISDSSLWSHWCSLILMNCFHKSSRLCNEFQIDSSS